MSDRRETASNGRVAHTSLRGRVEADRFSDGAWHRVCTPVAPLLNDVAPGTWRRERELVLHERFCVLEAGEGWSFGFAERDGYVGYLRRGTLAADPGTMTHVVAARQSYLVGTPDLKNKDEIEPVSFGTRLRVFATHEDGRWAEVERLRPDPEGHKTAQAVYVPAAHLRPLDKAEDDPGAVAERFLGTPYHWGGNSGFGIDCSGLVQASLLACGVACPGDSDQQARAFAAVPGARDGLRRGDLIFWSGHVALVLDADRMIHATAWGMTVLVEDIDAAIARILKQGEGPPTGFGRPLRRGDDP